MIKSIRLHNPSVFLGRMASTAGMSLVFLMAAGSANIAEGRDFENGAIMLAVGGGSIKNALFQSGAEVDATFSFSAGLDKSDNLRGSLIFKRVFMPDKNDEDNSGGAGVVIATEITDLQVDQNVDDCAWMHIEGMAGVNTYWSPKGKPFSEAHANHTFSLEAWDCDDGADQIWFEVRRPNGGTVRPGMSLANIYDPDYEEPVVITDGHVIILYPYDWPLP